MTPDAAGRPEPWPRPWQRDYADPTLPSRVCLYKDSRGTIFTCAAGEGYPDIYVPESEVTRLRAEVEASAKAVEALVPLARWALGMCDSQDYPGEEITEETIATARALLAARKGDEG